MVFIGNGIHIFQKRANVWHLILSFILYFVVTLNSSLKLTINGTGKYYTPIIVFIVMWWHSMTRCQLWLWRFKVLCVFIRVNGIKRCLKAIIFPVLYFWNSVFPLSVNFLNVIFRVLSVLPCFVYFSMHVGDDCRQKWINSSRNWECRKRFGSDVAVKRAIWNTFMMLLIEPTTDTHIFKYFYRILFISWVFSSGFFFYHNEILFSVFYLQIPLNVSVFLITKNIWL